MAVVDFFIKLIERIVGWMESIGKKYSKLSTLQQYLFLTLILALIIGLNLQAVAKSGDAIHKWAMIRAYVANGEFPLAPDHHMLRWGIMWPVIGLMKLFGDHIYLYYIFPIFSYITAGLLFYSLTRKIAKPEWSIWAFAIYAFCSEVINEGTQFLPVVPAFIFICLTLIFVVKAVEAKSGNESLWLFVAGLALIVAHGCKETSFYWAPGIFITLAFLPTQGYKIIKIKKFHITLGMLIFFLTCVGGLIAETLILNEIYGANFGRFELIQGSHFEHNKTVNSVSLFEYIFSIFRLQHWQGKFFDVIVRNVGLSFVLIGGVIALVKTQNIRLKFLTGAVLITFLCHCYLVIEVFPFTYPEQPIFRYITAVFVLGLFIYFYTLPTIWQWAKSGRIWGMLMLLFFNFVFLVSFFIAIGNERKNNTTVWQQEKICQLVKAAYIDDQPVGEIMKKRHLRPIDKYKAEPNKWATLYLRLLLDVDSAISSYDRKLEYTIVTKGDDEMAIIWLNRPAQAGDKPIILDEFQLVDNNKLSLP